MKHSFAKRALALLLALVCVMGLLPLSAFAAAGLSSAPGSITQKSSDYMKIGGKSVRYKAASSVINNVGLPYVFDEQVDVPGFGPTRALCAYQRGTLGPAANGQKWNYKEEVTHPSLKVLLTYIYSHTYGSFAEAGDAVGLEHWNNYWSDIWFLVAQAMSWYYEHGILKDVNTDREGFIEQAAEEFVAAMRLYHDTYGQSSFITDWSKIGTHSIIDSADGGVTGNSAYDYIAAGVNIVLDHPEYYLNYHLWIYEWDKSQTWMLAGQSGTPMQNLLIAVPDDEPVIDTVQLTVKKLEAGTNKPLAGVTFKIENANDPAAFSVTRQTGADGTITLTKEADNLTAGQYMITEEAVPEGYVAQTASQLVTVLPNGSANSVFTFYNEPDIPNGGDGSIRKVDADNPTVGIPGAVIRITSVKLDDGGSFTSEYTTGDGGYISKEDLDFSKLPTGSYIAEEITPPEGYILSSDVSKVKQAFVWDGVHDISLIFENSSKVRVQLKKVDESGQPLAGAIFVILRDGQVIGTEETKADGTITVSNVTEGYYQFREVSAPAGFDCDRSPVGVHVNAEDLQGEQTIVVTKMNHHKRSLTIQKRDAETGDPIPGTSFHIRGVNLGYENDVVTGADGKAVLEAMPSGCYEITETDVPKPYILDSNNRKTVWIDAEKDQDVVVDFVNSTLPGVRLLKLDQQTNKPIPGATFKIEEVDGGFTDQRQTDKDGVIFWENLRPGAYKVYEVTPAPNYVHDDTVHVVQLEPNHTTTIELTNIIKPTLKVLKVDSVTHSPIANVKFQIWRGSDDTITGELNDLGVYYTNASGEIVLEHIDTGWYCIKELEPAPGFTIKQPDTQDIYLKAGETHEVQFENVPKNCIIVEKYDSVTGEALPGCTFQLRYLAGTSGTGGTVIGQKVTGKNGIAMWTGLEPGAYVIEEVDPADGYSIINSSETVFLADNGEQSVITVRFDNMPDGLLLIRKVCATNPSITLQNAEFKITYADGTVIGDSNGIYRTDEKGEIRIEGLKPGKSVIVTEVQAPPGFIIDTQSQTIQIKEGRTVSLTFKNQPTGKLIIQKRDSQTNEVLPGAEFRVTTAAGCEVGLDGVIGTSTLSQNGIFTTDAQGEIRITNLAPGAYVLNEIKAPDGYVMDAPSTNVIIGTGGDTQTVIVKNSKKGSLIINKKDSVTGKPLEGVEFKVTTSSGQVVADQEGKLSSNGIYFTNKDGQIVISGLKPDTYVVTEQNTIPGYVIHEATRSQTVVVDANDTQILTFFNDPTATLVIHKYVEGTENEPLSGVAFKVTDGNGGAVGPDDGIYFTDKSGDITLTGLEPGMTVVAREIKTLDGFVLNGTPQDIQIKGGVQQLTFWNKRAGTLVIEKKDKLTGALISGAQFQLTYANGGFVDNNNGHLSSNGLYTTDDKGQIRIEGITGTVVVKETKPAPGYVIDQSTQVQTVTVNPMDTQTLTFLNEPLCSLTITKLDAVTGKPVPGTSFVVKDGNGAVLARCTTGQDGTATVTGLIPGSTVQVVETKVPDGYVLNTTPQVITVKNGSNALTGSSGGTAATPGGNSGTNVGGGNDVVVENDRKMTLTIKKYITGTNREPLAGVCFKLVDGFGTPIGAGDGTFYTNSAGEIVIPDLEPGTTVTAQEIATVEGFVLNGEPKTITIKSGKQAPELVFWNERAGTLVIRKLDSVTKKPLAGVQFELTHPDGRYVDADNGHLSSKGIFQTDQNGEIRVSVTGTVVVKEIKTLPGYSIDPAGQIQTVEVNPDDTQYLVFYNAPAGNFELIKVVAGNKEKRIPNVTFEIRRADDDALIDTITTDSEGRATLQLEAGNYYAVETECPKEYRLDSTRRTFTMKDGKNTTLTVENKAFSGILIHKTDSVTGKGIYGVSFLLYDSTNKPIGQYTSDNSGYVYIEGLTDGGRYYLRELENEGYIPDTQMKTVYVTAGETTLVEWKNTPITAQIQITKKSADYNSTNGLPAGTLLEGAVFEIYDKAGNVVDTIRSDSQGVATSKPLPLSRYTIREVKAPANYGVSDQELTAYLEHAGEIVRFEVTNKALSTGVSITKTGPKQAIAGQPVNCTFSSIANNSNVMLTSFYWRDTLPAEVRLDTVVTGTYNFPGRYKITYRVNGGEPRTLADNLSTQKNYTLAASAAALGLASNERVTEIMFVFGQAPAGFAQVEKPMLKCTAVRNMASTAFTNIADVGGVYNGVWVQAISRWVTTVYGKPVIPTLPKTGY